MSQIERESCPHCGEPAALAAHVCPHCRGGLLYDVTVDLPPPDPRARYQAARTVSSLGSPAPAFLDIQRALGQPGSRLASGVTREAARNLARAIEEHGGRTRLSGRQPLPAAEPAGRISWLRTAAAVALALTAGIGLFAWNRAASEPEAEPEAAPPALAVSAPTASPALSTRDLAERATPSTVKLRSGKLEGTGFFVTEDLLVTNAHVLGRFGDPIKAVFADGRELQGAPVKRDDWLDAALVRVRNAGARPLPLGDATSLQTGDRVVFIGTPVGLDFTVHEGIVSHSFRNIYGVGYLQIDANVNPGNSGGPLFDTRGRVVGIVSATAARGDGLGFVLPVNYLFSWVAPSLLPAPDPAPDSASWTRALAEIDQADQREVEKARGQTRPLLIGVALVPGRGAAAQVARLSFVTPSPQMLSFSFRRGDRILCSVYSMVSRWEDWGAGANFSADSRYLLWLRKNSIDQTAFRAKVPLDISRCPVEELGDSEIVLEDGDERANRLAL